jgi:DNA-binding LacI/PurR family transcriptional regulator
MSEAHPFYLPQELLLNLEAAMHELGQHLVVARLPARQLADSAWMPRVLREVSADGLLLHGVWPFPEACERIISTHSIPTVRINACSEQNAVYPEDIGDAARLTEHVLSKGHRRIAFLDTTQEVEGGHYSVEHRRQGYGQAMRDAGLEPRVITVDSKMSVRTTSAPQPVDVLERLLREMPDRPTAFVTYNERVAGPLAIAAARLGLSRPGQLSIATFCSSPMPPLGMHLTLMQVDSREIARSAIAMLLRRIEHGSEEASKAVPGTLFIGATVAPPETISS